MAIDESGYHEHLFQEVQGVADAEGVFVEDAFFEVLAEQLVAAGELETADRVHYYSPRGIQVDGYGGDPATTDGVLSIMVANFSQSPELTTLTASALKISFRRLTAFLKRSLDPSFRSSLEESTSAFGLADLIATRWPSIEKVRMVLITNRLLSARIDRLDSGEIDGVPISHGVWDLGRFHRYFLSGQEREDFEIALGEYGGPILALPAHLDHAEYESYLVIVPGKQLAEIYDRWGTRLLEQNVRVFLQARGKVNRGIRNTIAHNPEMFFAYNNGLTATAEELITADSTHGTLISGMRNFQIVNGGQTAASIHAALRTNPEHLDRVFVQMKLSVVSADHAVEVVPKISEYANTQNRVSASDFFSNHPFHVRIEEFSRRMFCPSADGGLRESKWFYERARGQYNDARSRLSRPARRKFDLEYPRKQLFTKTDIAKFVNCWHLKPHIVSRGSQRNFADFAQRIGSAWKKDSNQFNEMFYREVVAKAIVFKATERLVTDQPWYQGGYRANVVAYAVSKLAHDVSGMKRALGFRTIWDSQNVGSVLFEALVLSAEAVHNVIVDPPPSMRNVTEWAKQQACWHRASQINVEWPEGLETVLISFGDRESAKRYAAKDQRVVNGIEAQMAVVKSGAGFWKEVKQWGDAAAKLTPTEQGILASATAIPKKVPSEKQSVRIIEIFGRLRDEGCPHFTEDVRSLVPS